MLLHRSHPQSFSSTWSAQPAFAAIPQPQKPLPGAFCAYLAGLEGRSLPLAALTHPTRNLRLQFRRHLPCYWLIWRVQS